MKTQIGIFQGKGATNNKWLLETLYNNEPLTAWQLTQKIKQKNTNRISLHAIFNKSLRNLEKKGYIQRVGTKWILKFKGIIAVLIIQPEPKPWNEKWNKIFENYAKPLRKANKKYTIRENGTDIANLNSVAKRALSETKKFESWVALSNYVKNLMEKGFINLDVINDKSLFLLIVSQFDESEVSDSLKRYGINSDLLGD
jgi:hypothetical protein